MLHIIITLLQNNNSSSNTSLIDANTVPIVKPSQILVIIVVSNCLLIPECYKYKYIYFNNKNLFYRLNILYCIFFNKNLISNTI